MTSRPTVRNFLACLAGAIASIPANALLLAPLGKLLGAPDAPTSSPTDDPAAWRDFVQSMDAVHLLGPLVAHWNGAFVGSLVAALIAANRSKSIPLAVAGFVMVGGVASAFLLPGQPKLFLATDLAGYLPMGYLGWTVAQMLRKERKE